MTTERRPKIAIWDWPTRIFHWLLVLLIPAMWWTAEQDMMSRHRAIGYVLLGLLLFRILWGFMGSSTARFANFVKGPRAVLGYVGGRAAQTLGHNPLGGLSVVAMLALLSVQIGLGLFSSDEDGLESGPLARFISFDASRDIADNHEFTFDLLLVLIGIHLAAVLFYLFFRRSNLVKPMLVGTGEAPPGAEPMTPAPLWRFLLAATVSAAITLWIAFGV